MGVGRVARLSRLFSPPKLEFLPRFQTRIAKLEIRSVAYTIDPRAAASGLPRGRSLVPVFTRPHTVLTSEILRVPVFFNGYSRSSTFYWIMIYLE